ncbi:sensor histidine kinase [Streptomyces sp. NPDC046866]|uniref:sensor histidine kinase n=1 Tax=Streptomyces sp. NPDC046866 TaxID=3154921 RepID=UPI003452F1E7
MPSTRQNRIRNAAQGAATSTEAGSRTGGGSRAGTGTEPGAPAWSRTDALVVVGAAAVDLTAYSFGATDQGRPLTLPALGLLVLAALCLLLRRRHPVAVLAAVLALGAVLNLATRPVPHFGAAPAVALYSVARFAGPRVAATATAATGPLSLLGHDVAADASVWAWSLLGNAMAALLSAGAGRLVRRWHDEAEANRILLAERAVAEERRRIARELHDIVAHHITAMQLMAGGARANLTHSPDTAREALVTLEESGRTALDEMRRLLDVLRAGEEPEQAPPAPQPGTADLGRIVEESRLAGMDTELTVEGPQRPLPPSVGLAVFRIVQEGLTNARKHAGPARARVLLTYRPDEVRVEVRDDGAGARSVAGPGAGYGLIGMRERVALQGGSLEAGALHGGGFAVAARIPVAPGCAADGAEREEAHR